jgi:hypothetical protein
MRKTRAAIAGILGILISGLALGAGFFEQGTGPPGGYPSSPTFTHVGTGSVTVVDNLAGTGATDLVNFRNGTFTGILTFGGHAVMNAGLAIAGNMVGDNNSLLTGFRRVIGYYDLSSYTSLSAAIASIGSDNVSTSLYFPVTVSSDLTIPKNIHTLALNGGYFTVPTGKILTLNGPFQAGLYRVFSCSGTGQVVFGPAVVKEVFAEWWGAVSDNTTDSTAAVNAAVNAGPPVQLLGGTYAVDNVLVHGFYKIINGVGGASTRYSGYNLDSQTTTLRARGSGPVLDVQFHQNQFSNINFDGNFTAPVVVQLNPYTTKNKFYRCSFTRTTGNNTGKLASVIDTPGTIQDDFNVFELSWFVQDFANATDNAEFGAYVSGSNTQKQKFDRCYFQSTVHGIYNRGGSVDIIDSQFEAYSDAIWLYSPNNGRITGNYTETAPAAGSYFIKQTDSTGDGSANLILMNNWVNSAQVNLFYNYQSITSIGNVWRGPVYYTRSSLSLNRGIVSIGDYYGDTILGTAAGSVDFQNSTIDNVIYGTLHSGFASYDFGSIADNAISSITMSVPGAVVRNTVEPQFEIALPAGMIATGRVIAADNVQVTLINRSGSTYTPGAMYIDAYVRKRPVY